MEELLRYGERFFDELEIAVYRNREIGVNIELNELSMSAVRERTITIIRGIKNRSLGLAIIDSEDGKRIKEGIERAYRMAKLNSQDKRWKSLPSPGEYRKPRKINEELKDVSPDYFVELAKRGIKLALEKDKNIVVAGGGGGVEWSEERITNSQGVDVIQEGGGAYIYFELIGMKEGKVTPGIFDFDAKLSLDLNVEMAVENAARKVKWAYTVEKSKTEETKVIVEPWALSMLFQYTIFPAFSGERLIKGTTPLVSKVDESVASELLTIYDDPLHEMSLNPRIADGEGVPTRKNVLIEKGKFKGFLWDNYWAKIKGTESTGSGIRNPSTGGISIGMHNAVIEKGKKSLEDMIGEIEHGYLVDGFQGAHSSNPDNGNFAVVANPAFIIEDGEIKGSTVFMMSGNVYDLLNQVYEISKEQKAIPFMGTVISPSIAFENVRIAGK
ncbi:TldD/PmbA family protein [Palaeococcus sp. (in: euryarchaeotes)]